MAVIRERRNKEGELTGYKVVVTLGRDERNRKVYVSMTIPRPEGLTPKREEKEVKRIADEWEHEQRMIYEENQSVFKDKSNRKRITVKEFVDELWMARHVKDGTHTPSTIAFYTYMAEDIKRYFSNKRLVDIDKNEVLNYLHFLRNDARTKSGKPYSPVTIQHHYNTLRGIMDYAVYIEYLVDNPCDKIKASDKPKRGDKEIDFLEEDDAIRFLSCLESDKEKLYWAKKHVSHLCWKTMVNIMIVTGLRRGELAGLQWGDIDKKSMMLNVRRNVTLDASDKSEKKSEKKIHIGETKGKRIRRVALSKYLLGLLDELMDERKKNYREVSKTDYIFCRFGDQKLPMYPTEPTRMMTKFVKRHGLPNVSPHDLRHTAASLAIQGGASVKEIQALLGHRDAATTLRFYAGISEQIQKGTVEEIEGILRGKVSDDKS